MKIGIPRALLYYRYHVMWETFFKELGHTTIASPPTNKDILDAGSRRAIDENCLSSKLFFGHVEALEGKCNAVFVPRIANYGDEGGVFCSRFEALYDMTKNTFRDTSIRFITCNVDIQEGYPEDEAFRKLGISLGAPAKSADEAYKKAIMAMRADKEKQTSAEEKKLEDERIKILVVGHSYNLYDEYIGKPITKIIERLDAVPILADRTDPERALKDSANICDYVPWTMSRELLGAIYKFHDQIDGIILMTAFPCGPDSLVNEMIIRRVKDRPILNLLLDSQDANAGIETRLESFIDIIRFRKEMRF